MTGAAGTVERIVVALLADADRQAAVEIAAALAQHFGVDISGILVEERELFDLAELGLASEIGMTTGRARMVAAGSFVDEVLLSLVRHERAFAALALKIGREVALARVRMPAVEPLRAAGPNDLLLFATSSRRVIEREMAEAILQAARRAAGVGIVGRMGTGRPGPLLAVASSADRAERALPILSGLSDAYRSRLEIVVADPSRPPMERSSILGGTSIRWTGLATLPTGRAAAELTAARGARLLVGEAGTTLARDPVELRALMRWTGVPVLLLNLERD